VKLRIPTLTLFGAIAAIAVLSASQAEVGLSPKASQKLARALEGRTAGPPVNCISNIRGQAHMRVIDDGTILFRDQSTIYLQQPRSECSGIEDGKYSLITRKFGTGQICSGDINQLVDIGTGFQAGYCTFGPFVPYRRTR
jgi:hypothetical protein